MLKNKSRISPIFHKGSIWHIACLIVSFSYITLLFTAFASAEEFIYDSQDKRNPFMPLVTSDGRLLLKLDSPKDSQGLSLEGIIYDESSSSYAIVNSEIVRVGDWINGYQVIKIERDRAVFIKEGQITEIFLEKEER